MTMMLILKEKIWPHVIQSDSSLPGTELDAGNKKMAHSVFTFYQNTYYF